MGVFVSWIFAFYESKLLVIFVRGQFFSHEISYLEQKNCGHFDMTLPLLLKLFAFCEVHYWFTVCNKPH